MLGREHAGASCGRDDPRHTAGGTVEVCERDPNQARALMNAEFVEQMGAVTNRRLAPTDPRRTTESALRAHRN